MKRPPAVEIPELDKYLQQFKKDGYIHIKNWGYFYVLPARQGELINPHCKGVVSKRTKRTKFKAHDTLKDFINSNK